MGHKGPVLRPRCIETGRAQTQILIYSSSAWHFTGSWCWQNGGIHFQWQASHSKTPESSSTGMSHPQISHNIGSIPVLQWKVEKLATRVPFDRNRYCRAVASKPHVVGNVQDFRPPLWCSWGLRSSDTLCSNEFWDSLLLKTSQVMLVRWKEDQQAIPKHQ